MRKIFGGNPGEIPVNARNHKEESFINYGEATRSKQPTAYHLIPAVAHEAEAVRYQVGAEKHGEGNWKHGDKQFVKQLFNHLQCHITDILKPAVDRRESIYANVGAIKWAASAILWYSTYNSDMFVAALAEIQEGLAEKK